MTTMKHKDQREQFETKIGIKFNEGKRTFTAFLTNFKTKSYRDKIENEEKMAVLCFFQSEEGETLKYYYSFNPYFYVGFVQGFEKEVCSYLQSKIEKVASMQIINKIDLQEVNHLSGRRKQYIKLSFRTIKDLNNAKTPLKSIIDRRKRVQAVEDDWLAGTYKKSKTNYTDVVELITGIRQYDVPYHSRVCIDTGLRAGKWFHISVEDKFITHLQPVKEKKSMPDLKILSYDIETAKQPLKFPDSERNEIMMISLMYEGEAFLIINCQFCGQQVQEFSYDPKPEFSCHVTVFNEKSERDLLLRFSNFMTTYKPTIVTTYNGDKFDYPYIAKRCELNHIRFVAECGMLDNGGQFYGNYMSHLDCYYWVDRDAYLPQGSRGLKAVAKAKLNYEPIEVDPEDMVELAKTNTQRLAEYSVSDAVATYFLYIKHIHGFIFALSTIIPMFPDEVLRKGSGTLCQNLLMVEAFNRNIIFPNKKMENFQKFHKGNLLDSETYTGGKVQCLRTGVYRADFLTDFTLDPSAFGNLIGNIDQIIKFAISHQMPEQSFHDIANLEQVKGQLASKLEALKNVKNPSKYEAFPLIYHIDVAAMYPNIILTNRLQPVSIVNDKTCSGCLFNSQENNCKRDLQWEWKGQVFPLNQGQYLQVKQKFSQKNVIQNELSQQYQKALKQQVKAYCQKIYKKTHNYTSQIKTDTVCMRQNSFYVDTVRAFRDRRYEYKTLAKIEQGNVQKHQKNEDPYKAKESKSLLALYESMQLAHKIILNSYYGYVMRKGARWYSMEMAAMVTYMGSNIIMDSKNFVEGRIGKPLELDTDGIWMLLPKGFPQDVKIKFRDGKTYKLSYPCQILNHLIYEKYANPQYQTLVNQSNFQFQTKKEMTIFFQIDGPYKAMMIPAAKEKQKTTQLDIQQHNTQLLKKRYVVFGFNNKIKEFKGFQMKRRGQLRITKVFQQQIFPQYLKGESLTEMYAHCAQTAKKYISIIQRRGQGMDVNEILDYLQQSRVLSKDVKEYGQSKGVAINSAKRLSQFLGPQVIKGKGGLCCYFVISAYPVNRPVTQRAIPTQIFQADLQTQRQFLFKWTRNDALLKEDVDIKKILDWGYYFERLSTQIQKMVCIPAVLQCISNPVPQIQLPDWLQKKTFDMRHHKQQKISSFQSFFTKQPNATPGKISTQKQTQQTNKKQNLLIQERKPISITNRTQNSYSMKSNFSKWLVEQKKIWRQKKRQTQNNEGFKSNQLKSILHIISQKTAGNFNVWYYAGGKIQQLLLTMKRKYYCKGKGTKKAPREQGDALQIAIDEGIFQKQADYYDSFIGQTFYQTKLPLITSLIMKKGNLWRVNRQSLTYTQEEIQQNTEGYLLNIESHFMQYALVCHCKVMDNRYIWTVVFPKANQYTFIFVDRAKMPNHDQLLLAIRRELRQKEAQSQSKHHSEAKISIKHFNQEGKAGSFVNQMLQNYMKTIKQPYMVGLQAESVEQIKVLGVKNLETQLPVLYLGKVSLNVQQSEILDWKSKSIKHILSSNLSEHILKLISWARYSQIPVCNLSMQPLLLDYVTNIQFGRLLHDGDYLTWWNAYNGQLLTTYESSTFTGKVVNKGLYKSYAIQIDMENLAINSIANAEEMGFEDRQTAMIVAKKGAVGSSKFQSLDEMSKVKKSFQYIKKMIKGWIKDLQLLSSDQANELLRNFHKWVSTRSNSLFDPLLMRMVTQLMKRFFYKLMKQLSSLGMTVVYANFYRIIIATDKFTFNEAHNSIQYTLRKCVQQNHKLFRYIKLTPLDNLMYKALLFDNQFNFIGITAEEQPYYKFKIEEVMHTQPAFYMKILIINFIKRLAIVQSNLEVKFSQNKMRLVLDYEEMVDQEMKNWIVDEFKRNVIEVVRKLMSDWQRRKEAGNNQTDAEDQNISSEDEEDQENDSFVVSDEDQENMEIEGESEDQRNKREKKRSKKLKEKHEQEQKMDVQWSEDNQLDTLIQNLFGFLMLQENYRDELLLVRKQALCELNLLPSIEYRKTSPIYPSFQLPCQSCYLVNDYPGNCQHCEQPLICQEQLEQSVWKMMQEQGRDLYCENCKKGKEEYLRKCGCGGKWIIKEKPLEWIKYNKREEEQWKFVNQVFEFMGIGLAS